MQKLFIVVLSTQLNKLAWVKPILYILAFSLNFVVQFLFVFTFTKYEQELKKEKNLKIHNNFLYPTQHVQLSRQNNNKEI
jgi:tellurite resistance protein TehA-like permease